MIGAYIVFGFFWFLMAIYAILILFSILIRIKHWLYDDTTTAIRNPIVSFIMQNVIGYEKTKVNRNEYNGGKYLYIDPKHVVQSDGGWVVAVISFYVICACIISELLYNYTIPSIIFIVVVGGLHGARALIRLMTKLTKIEKGN